MSWLSASVRDWRVWALWLFLQAPGFRVMARFLPDPLRPAVPLWLAGIAVFYGALLDRTPDIRSWFEEAGFAEVAFDAPDNFLFSVGVQRFDGQPRRLEPGRRLFDFVGYENLRAADADIEPDS